jgi:hypothetical protein
MNSDFSSFSNIVDGTGKIFVQPRVSRRIGNNKFRVNSGRAWEKLNERIEVSD